MNSYLQITIIHKIEAVAAVMFNVQREIECLLLYSSENITITFAMIIAIIIEKIKYFSVNLWLVFSSEDKGC
jgi:hypothetical protein